MAKGAIRFPRCCFRNAALDAYRISMVSRGNLWPFFRAEIARSGCSVSAKKTRWDPALTKTHYFLSSISLTEPKRFSIRGQQVDTSEEYIRPNFHLPFISNLGLLRWAIILEFEDFDTVTSADGPFLFLMLLFPELKSWILGQQLSAEPQTTIPDGEAGPDLSSSI